MKSSTSRTLCKGTKGTRYWIKESCFIELSRLLSVRRLRWIVRRDSPSLAKDKSTFPQSIVLAQKFVTCSLRILSSSSPSELWLSSSKKLSISSPIKSMKSTDTQLISSLAVRSSAATAAAAELDEKEDDDECFLLHDPNPFPHSVCCEKAFNDRLFLLGIA